MTASLHILLIEDNPGDVELIREQLLASTVSAYRVEAVGRLAAAVPRLGDATFDAVLLDLSLPDSDGLDTVRRAVAANTADLPVLVLTGLDDDAVGLAAIRAGAQDYLVKGRTTTTMLDRAIRYAVEHQRAELRERHLTRVLRGVRNVNQLICRERDPERLIRQTCDLLAQGRGYRRIWAVVSATDAWPRVYACTGADPPLSRAIADPSVTLPCCAMALDTPEQVLVCHADREPCLSCPIGHDDLDEACMVVAIGHRDTSYGVLHVTLPTGLSATDDERGLLAEVAGDIGFALHDIAAVRQRQLSDIQYRFVVDNTVDCIWVMAPDLTFTYVNPAVEQIFGYTVDEFLGTNLADYCTPDDLALMQAKIAEVIAHLPATAPIVFETRLISKAGETIPVEIAGRLVVDDNGRPTGLQGVTRDLRERRAAEAERDRLQAQLRQAQKMEAIGRLAGGVAHDFNNVLSVIVGHCDLMARTLHAGDPLAEDLDEIKAAANRAAGLTRQLLTFSRRDPLEPVVLDLNQVVANIDKMLRRLIGEDIRLVTDLAPDTGTVKADTGQLEQVIMNLAVNARDAMPAGGRLHIATARVHLRAGNNANLPAGAYARLTVSDTGCGMDATTREHVFEPFFTTKEPGKGTGLGLATVYGIVTRARGGIRVDSAPEQGSTFEIFLPSTDEAAPASSPAGIQAPAARGSETILVVEDNDSLRDLACIFLGGLGYHAIGAANGGEALRAVGEGNVHPDLLLTDVIMPGINGKVLADRLRRDLPDLRVLYMSGYTGEAVTEGIRSDSADFLQKPFTLDDLAAHVREALEQGSAR